MNTRLMLSLSAAGLLGLASCSRAQGSDNPRAVQPERPTVATHAGTVAAGWLEIESGIEADTFDEGGHGDAIPTLLKFGLGSHVQLGVGLPASRLPGSGLGIGDFNVGVKWRLADDAPVLRRFAILPSLKFPTGRTVPHGGTGTTDVSLLLISSRTVRGVDVDVNVGGTWRSGNGASASKSATLWTVSTGFPQSRSLQMAAELFGYPGTAGPAGQRPLVAFLAGPTLLVHPWLEIDAGVIVPLSGPQPQAVYAGLVWNLGHL